VAVLVALPLVDPGLELTLSRARVVTVTEDGEDDLDAGRGAPRVLDLVGEDRLVVLDDVDVDGASGSSDTPGSVVTRTVAGADRSGTGPARNRSTLATARSQRWPAPSVSVTTTALAAVPRITITTMIKAALRQRR
jgi:hypothetical protein